MSHFQSIAPDAQFPSAVPFLDEQVSKETQVPYITRFVLAVDKIVHWLKWIILSSLFWSDYGHGSGDMNLVLRRKNKF